MIKNRYKIRAKVWIYPGVAAWHFVGIPKNQSKEIREKFGAQKRGWNSLPVTVTVGKTAWNTSIFFDKREDAYLLPLKADVRKKEGIYSGDMLDFFITIRV